MCIGRFADVQRFFRFLNIRSDAAFETVMRQCNRKLFRIARGVLRDDAEAEESLQEAYLIAYTQISTFRGEAR